MAKKAKGAGDEEQGSNGAASGGQGGDGGEGGETVAGYFRKIFKETPRLLKERSNEELYKRWLADHPGNDEVPQKVRTGLQNIKSVLRTERANKKAKKRAEAAAQPQTQVAQRGPRRGPVRGLENLEYQIDECLAHAKRLDAEALEEVISLLRQARNAVIVKMGTD